MQLLRSVATNIVCLGALTLGAITPAEADRPYTNWSGIYLGVHAGAGWSDIDWRIPAPGNFYGAGGTGFSTDPDGGLFGGHVGINHQIGNFVIGAEVTYSGPDMKVTDVGPIAPFPNDRFSTQIEDLFTVTGRLGYAWQSMMLYAKGGYASAQIEMIGLSGVPVPNVGFNAKERADGWVVGGGLEYKFHPNFILGVEYNYINLDSTSISATTAGAVPGLPVRFDSDDLRIQTVTARLSFLFGGDREVIEPLK